MQNWTKIPLVVNVMNHTSRVSLYSRYIIIYNNHLLGSYDLSVYYILFYLAIYPKLLNSNLMFGVVNTPDNALDQTK